MKFNLTKTIAVFSLFCVNVSNAQVGIGVPAENIHPSAELEVKSNTKGFLPPRMTKAERDAIVAPAAGLLIYQTDGDVNNTIFNITIPESVTSIGANAFGGTTNTSLTSGPGLYYFDGTAWKNVVGAQGATGSQGIQGETGAVGPRGDTGAQGIQGEVGLQGIKGDKGETGAVGAQGPQGEPGTSNGASQLTINNSSTSTTPSLLSFTTATPGTSVSSLQTDNSLFFTPSTNTLVVPNIYTENLTGNVTGTASNALKVSTVLDVTSAVNNFITFTNSSSTSSGQQLRIDSGLTYVPATNTLSATNINASLLTGSLNGNASSASKITLNSSASTVNNYLSFSPSTSGVSDLQTNNALTFNPSSGTLTAPLINATTFTGNVTGTASSAMTVSTTPTASATTFYPSFALAASASSSSSLFVDSGLSFIPITNTLSATNFTGSLQGNVTGDLTGNVTGTTLKGRNFIQLNPTVVVSTTPTSDNIVTAGYISATGSITLPTAAAIASSIGGSIGKGTSVEFTVENSSTGDATLVLGTGMSVQTSPTIAGTNSLVVSQANAIGRFRLVFTSATTAMLFRVY